MKEFLKQHSLIWIPFLVSIVIAVLLDRFSPISITIYENIILNAVLQILFYSITIHTQLARIETVSKGMRVIEQINRIGKLGRLSAISRDFLAKLEQLANGDYEVKQHPADIWQEHIECIKYLSSGDVIFATCYYPESDSELTKLFSFRKYEEYCNCSFDAIKKGIKLNKIFILRTRALLSNPSLIQHFKFATEKTKGKYGLIIVDELPSRNGISDIEEDFMIWGSKLLSISLLGDDSIVGGLRMSTNPVLIEKYKNKFEELRQIALPLTSQMVSTLQT